MDLSFTKEDLAFQKEVRDWIAANYTEELKARNAMSKNGYLDKDGMLEWQRKLDDKGWFVANWPEEFGGPGGDFGHDAVITYQVNLHGCDGFGGPLHSAIVAPYIQHYGSEEQKKRWLPKM